MLNFLKKWIVRTIEVKLIIEYVFFMSHFNKLEKIQETEGQIIEIENFLSQDEVSELLNYVNSTKKYFC